MPSPIAVRLAQRIAWIMAVSLLLAPATHAFVPVLNETGAKLHWELVNPKASVHTNVVNPKTKAIRFFLASDAFSKTNTAAELNAVRACFNQWQSVPGTHIKFEEGGLVAPGVDINTTDNTNVVFWVKNGTLINGGRDDLRGALGLSYQDFFDDYSLAEADIVLNGTVNWYTDSTIEVSPDRFVEAVALHEIGHFIGLNHSPVGGSTMMVRGSSGMGTQTGLSADEIAAAQWLYPAAGSGPVGTISGVVTVGGNPILGATVVAESELGSLAQATVTSANGTYTLGALPVGNYKIRVCPLDPRSNRSTVLTGLDIDPFGVYANAETGFLPTPNTDITLQAGENRTLNYALAANTSAMRITRIRPPQDSPNTFFSVNTAVTIPQGRTEAFVGVYGPGLPTSGATLRITGDGITHGAISYSPEAFNGVNLISVKISVAANATPGLRSFVLESGDRIAYANGFLEVASATTDLNFDGLADAFQRKYFPLWTSPEARPDADPDQDGFNNLQEYAANTHPLDVKSFPVKVGPFRIRQILGSAPGMSLRWDSIPNIRYRVWGSPTLSSVSWKEIGSILGSQTAETEYLDATPLQNSMFYRVDALP